MPQNILEVDFKMPETVYILAPGLNGRDVYDRIPGDGFVIVVNKGVMIPQVQKHLWMAEDFGLIDHCPWFVVVANIYIYADVPIEKPLPTPVFGQGKMTKQFPDVPYSYPSGPSMGHHPSFRINPNYLRGGATISCKALQLATIKGAKRIVLVGVDLHGRKYFDGTETASTLIKGDTWWCVKKFNRVIVNAKQTYGIEVVSLSPTALNIPIVAK